MGWSVIGKVLRVLGLLVLAGCGVSEVAEVEPTAERVVLPTVTAIPRVTPTVGLSQIELEGIWRLPIVVSALNYTTCLEAQRVLAALEAGEMTRPEVATRLETLALFVEVADEELAGWEVADEDALGMLKSLLVADTKAVQMALAGWLSDGMVNTAVYETLSLVCAAADQTGERVSDAAVAAGFNLVRVRALLDEAQATLAAAIATQEREQE